MRLRLCCSLLMLMQGLAAVFRPEVAGAAEIEPYRFEERRERLLWALSSC